MTRYFFSGGQMPSDDLLLYFPGQTSRIERTLECSGYPLPKDSGGMARKHGCASGRNTEPLFGHLRNLRKPAMVGYWRIFFMACAELWGYRRQRMDRLPLFISQTVMQSLRLFHASSSQDS